jgi:hypothetical protein
VSRRDVLKALPRLPADVRAFVLERVTIVSTGRVTAGLALPPPVLGDDAWVVLLSERTGVTGTFVHEIAHAWLGHVHASADHEREAAGLAREWGFDGPSTDPDDCAERHVAGSEAVPLVRANVTADVLTIACRCGAACSIYAPTAAGLPAEVGAECLACGWVTVVELDHVCPCPACKARADVRWPAVATPAAPVAVWTCACGETRTLALQTAPAAAPQLAEPEWAMRTATAGLSRLGPALRSLSTADPWALESCRASLWFWRARLLRAARALGADARGATLTELAREVAAAGASLESGEVSQAAARVDSVARALDALSAAGDAA